MWRAILVDDEEYVRWELAALFPWNRYQFELVGEAENAASALELIETLKPDLVITDIRMPEMDGLALISRLAHDYPRLEVAVVSAFNDFPYVREALRLGAVDYLIKAEATVETAGAFLERVADILEDRHRVQNERDEMTTNLARYHWLATESFWRDTLTRSSDEMEIETRAGQLGIVTDHCQFGIVIIHITNYDHWSENDQAGARRDLEDRVKVHWNCGWEWKIIDFKRGDFIVIASCHNAPAAVGSSDILHDVARWLALDGEGKWFVSASSRMCVFSDLPVYFKEVREVNLLRLYQRNGPHIRMDDLTKLRQAAPPNIPELLAGWERVLRTADPKGIHDFLTPVFERVLPASFSPGEARWLILDYFNTVRRVFFEYQIRWDDTGRGKTDFSETLDRAESLCDWQKQLEELVSGNLQSIKADDSRQGSLSIRNALTYIQSNFTRDLSLDEVAGYAGVSKSYLSRVFPEYTGEHFSDYLQRLRIERAKELLWFTNDHIYEIASKVGFWNSRYFSKVFHESVGMTPADYRRGSQS